MKEYDNAFEFIDRYDFVLWLAVGLIMVGAIVLGAPLWVVVPIMFVGVLAGFIRHFEDIMGPAEPSNPSRESHPEHVAKHDA
jgi:hypothetical protein